MAVEALLFGLPDYTAFIMVMLVSMLVGVYYGIYKKQDSEKDYLLGGKSMPTFPIAMSLIASNISGITMLGVPTDMYSYGTQLAMLSLVGIPLACIVIYFFLPMFYKLQYTSSYEYLEKRFDVRARQLASLLYTLGQLLYLPVVIYVPCLAFNQVSGLNVHLVSPLACLVCIFYTSLGGLRAVVWTDAIQLLSLILASIVVVTMGIVRLGGIGPVWEKNMEGGRLEFFNLDPSPFARCTFWAVFLGEMTGIVSNVGTSPTSVQRYLCLPTMRSAKRSVMLLAVGYCLTRFLTCLTGVIMYATYHGCDPVSLQVVGKTDQLLPHFVMDVAGALPGLPGIFIAGIFSAALSTMSSGLNTLSGTIYKDFVEKRLRGKVSEHRASIIMKSISVIVGAISVMLMFVVERLGGVLQVAVSLGGITGGARFGLFMLGMFFPWVNTKGALCGALSSLLFMTVTYSGSSWAHSQGLVRYNPLPTRTDLCNSTDFEITNWNVSSTAAILSSSSVPPPLPTAAAAAMDADEYVFPLFRVSYFYYEFLGTLVTIGVGLAVTYLTGPHSLDEADPDLFSPVVAKYLRRNYKKTAQCYTTVPTNPSMVPLTSQEEKLEQGEETFS